MFYLLLYVICLLNQVTWRKYYVSSHTKLQRPLTNNNYCTTYCCVFVRTGIDVLIKITRFLYFLYLYSSVIELTAESTYEQTTEFELGNVATRVQVNIETVSVPG